MAPSHAGRGWLQVDIEGHELVVLRQLARQAELPRLLTFEHLHISPVETMIALEMLATPGYTQIGWHTDDAAFLRRTMPHPYPEV